jgi:glycosyltransferase involved in cell wall biosynthesis
MQESRPILSIIIPHYNVSDYLDCLYTVLFPQITEKVEVILIDDNSTDDTRNKMQYWEHQQTNPNLKFYYLQTNLGLSGVRNEGSRLALGEYLWFIDSDDTITQDAVMQILQSIEKSQADGIVFDFFRFYSNETICNDTINKAIENHEDIPVKVTRSKYRSLLPETIINKKQTLLSSLFDDAQMYVCFYVIRKKYWDLYPFPKGRSYEDIAVMPKIIYQIDSLYYLPKPLYYYRQREGSIVNTPTLEHCFDMNENMQEISQYFQEKPLSESVRVSLYTFYLRMLRLSYGHLSKYHLLSPQSLQRYQKYETAFLAALPWHTLWFIRHMRTYSVFKFTSLLFLTYKPLYRLVKKILGRY